jgi:hypothetical protein
MSLVVSGMILLYDLCICSHRAFYIGLIFSTGFLILETILYGVQTVTRVGITV